MDSIQEQWKYDKGITNTVTIYFELTKMYRYLASTSGVKLFII